MRISPGRAALWLCAAGVALCAAIFGGRPERQAVALKPVRPAPRQAAPIGPGELPRASPPVQPPAPAPAGIEGAMPPDGLVIGRDGHLVLDKAVLELFDYFLMNGMAGDTASHVAALRAYLRARLPPAAFSDAAAALNRYVAYLEALPTLPAPALADSANRHESAAVWCAGRTRLRQSLLGMALTRAWFGEEEERIQRELNALRDGGDAAALSREDPANRDQASLQAVWSMSEQGAPLESRRERVARDFGEAAARRYEEYERQELAWQEQYAQYRTQADRIRENADTPADERERQIEALRALTFPTGPERVRARALDAATGQKTR